MKENTKYLNYQFIGKINVDEIQPWFDFTTAKPWDDPEIPWVLENRVRREILISLAKRSKTFDELYNSINFSPNPLLISKEEYKCNVSYQWTKKAVENHLLNLEWYNLIKKSNDKYELTFPILDTQKITDIEKHVVKFAENWINIIKQTKNEVDKDLNDIKEKTHLYKILVEKAVEKLYVLLKNENLLPNKPNIKTLWAEQLRKIKFEEWVEKNY